MKRSIMLAACLVIMMIACTACGGKKETIAETSESSVEAVENTTVETNAVEDAGNWIIGAASREEAQELELNTLYHGEYSENEIWVSFTTGSLAEATYRITLENLTVDSEDLLGSLLDEEENYVTAADVVNGQNVNKWSVRAMKDGAADTATLDNLQPDTTYYLRLSGRSKVEYSLRITDNEQAFDVNEGRSTLGKGDVLVAASNMDTAPLLTANVRYQGVIEKGYQWFAFHTRPEKEDLTKITETIYKVTLENLTVGSNDLYGYVVDEYGYYKDAAKQGNGQNVNRYSVRALQDGTADTATFNDLEPDTTYFFKVKSDNEKAAYVVKITAPDDLEESGDDVSEAGDAESESKLFTMASDEVAPGSCQEFALHVPLDTMIPAEYTEGFSYLAFTTDESEEAEYNVTLVNRTSGSEDLYGILVNEEGEYQEADSLRNGVNVNKYCLRAKKDGRADTAHYTNLEPNTTYFLKIKGNSRAAYAFRASCITDSHDAKNRTSSNLTDVMEELDAKADLEPGTNQTAAPRLKMNTNYHGKYMDGYSWVSFTTREKKNVEYAITLENQTVGSEDLYGVLVDEYGDYQEGTLGNGNNINKISVIAKQDGTADTAWASELKPNTTYYFGIWGNSKADYRIKIGAPKEKKSKKRLKEEKVVFKTPLELNHSLIQFKGDLAEFVDPAKVEKVLAPVAETILAHPDHKFLLAGTTAWAGDQKEREVLSLDRAKAVKAMLVEKFGVPKEQLLTAGLGYEKDIYFERGRDRDANNQFIETEAAKNRRVVILDEIHDIAKKIIKDTKKK